jgi:GxxExxY protein
MGTKHDLLYGELCYEVIGCAFEAFKKVGVGFDEIRYHKNFDQNLLKKGLKAKYKVPLQLHYRGEMIAELEIDEIVEDKIIVELKCIQTDFIPENYAQIMTYLKAKELRLGLLINFGLHKAFPKRVIFDEQRENDYEQWDDGYFQNPSTRKAIESVIESLRRVDTELGVAYHNTIYQAALAVELRRNRLQ